MSRSGQTKLVFVAGSGPAVIVMSEMPGIYPAVSRFARWVRDAGFTVWMPQLFGDAGPPADDRLRPGQHGARLHQPRVPRLRRERVEPGHVWLRALAAHAHPLCGGKGVGAIGMCFTGNFALSMMLEPAVLAPVLSQPSLPLFRAGGMHISPDELEQVKKRLESEDLTVRAYRFEGDPFCKAARFEAYQQALGAALRGARAAGLRGAQRHAAEAAQRRDHAPDRPRRRADARGGRRDPRVLRAAPEGLAASHIRIARASSKRSAKSAHNR